MNLISHWYFTACLQMRPQDAANVIAILDALDLPTGDVPLAEAALQELILCDIWTKVYAVPQIFAMAVADRSGELRSTVKGILVKMLNISDEDEYDKGSGTFGALMAPLVESALFGGTHGQGEVLVKEIEATAEYLLNSGTAELEDVPYLGDAFEDML